jgi:hypothetical protein
MHVGYWWENQKAKDHKENQNVGGWIILKCILDKLGGIECIDWLTIGTSRGFFVNTAMNIRFP